MNRLLKLILSALALLLAILLHSCSKPKADACYQCTAVSGTQTYNSNVCTTGDPKAGLQRTDANGTIGWTCKQR